MHRIALFGGTFDPIHYGHLRLSTTIQAEFNFDSYIFLPCKIPLLKQPCAVTSADRVKMLQLALAEYPQFAIDLREIQRSTPSYTYETLKSYREEFPESALTLIMGHDSFLSLPAWHKWQELLTLANFLVIQRNPPQPFSATLNAYLLEHQLINKKLFLKEASGKILQFNAGDYPISSSEIRKKIQQQQDISKLVPDTVCQYIQEQCLYKPE